MGILSYAGGLGLISLTVYIMVIGRDLIVPFMISVVIWYLINILSDYYQKLIPEKWNIPRAISYIASLVTIILVINFLIEMISSNITEVKVNAPIYQENFIKLTAKIFDIFGITQEPNFAQIVNQIDLAPFITNLAGTLASLAGSASLILIYVLFLILEQKYFNMKLNRLLVGSGHRETVFGILEQISIDVKTYIGMTPEWTDWVPMAPVISSLTRHKSSL